MHDFTGSEGASPGFAVGDVVAERYQLLEQLSGSPLRSVFRAYDGEVEVEVALWLLRAEEFGGAPGALAAAESLRRVRNAHVLRLFDSSVLELPGETAWLYLAWQLGTSASLESLLASATPASPDQLWRIAEGLATALQAGHDKLLVHGWFSPADVVEVAGQVKLCGLGLLGGLDATKIVPKWGPAVRYVAPELLADPASNPTPSSDWYSLGVVLLDLATGMAGSPVEEARASLAAGRPKLWSVLEPALRADPARRLDSAEQLLPPLRTVCDELMGAVGDFGGGGRLSFDDGDEATEIDRSPSEPFYESAISEKRLESSPVVREAVSMKPVGGTSGVEEHAFSPVKSPVRPVLRSLESLPGADVVRQDLGTFAPPKVRGKREARQTWLYVLLALVTVVGAVSLVLLFLGESRSVPTSSGQALVAPPKDARAVAPAIAETRAVEPPPRPAEPCPEGMVMHEKPRGRRFCLDAHEWPGAGQMPTVEVRWKTAQARCQERGRRLCTGGEWEAGCRQDGVASWSYGATYRAEICNVLSGEIGLSGSFAECRTSLGVYDMGGNAAEWVADGQIRGGSAADRHKGRCSQARPRPTRKEAYSDVGFRCCADAIDSGGQAD